MSAVRVRAAMREHRQRQEALDEQQLKQTLEGPVGVRQCLFDDPDGDTFDDQVEGYMQWTAHQEREEHEWDVCFYPSKSYTRSWTGWVFRTGVHGTGYYRDGVADESPTANPLDGLCKVKLELDKVLSTVGDPLVATVEEEVPVIEKEKRSNKRRTRKKGTLKASRDDITSFLASETVHLKDVSHRGLGLWAIDTINPNAWGGGVGLPGDHCGGHRVGSGNKSGGC